MSLIKVHERQYISETLLGAERTNLVEHRPGDSHYRVYPNFVEFYTAPPEGEYLISPDERHKSSGLGTNHFWNL